MKLLFIFILTLIPLSFAFAETVTIFGEVRCKSKTECFLIERAKTLSEARHFLVYFHDSKPFPAIKYDQSYVKIIGLLEKDKLRVQGIALSMPDYKLMSEKDQ